jgi:uncharacterized protein
MKSRLLLIAIFSIFLADYSYSQTPAPVDKTRYIDVTGSSEMNINPDEVELEFTLKEYYKNGTKEKFTLAEAEKEFYSIISKYGLKERDIILSNSLFWSDWSSWWNNKEEELKYKKITLKIDSSINLTRLVKDLSKEWLSNIVMTKMKNKNEQAFRKEIKIQAIKAAKTKASYLLSAIGEETGKVLYVEEVADNESDNTNPRSNMLMKQASNDGSVSNTPLIKLRYEIRVRFEIK